MPIHSRVVREQITEEKWCEALSSISPWWLALRAKSEISTFSVILQSISQNFFAIHL